MATIVPYEEIRYDVQGGQARITLARPDIRIEPKEPQS